MKKEAKKKEADRKSRIAVAKKMSHKGDVGYGTSRISGKTYNMR
jgi:hypothetical protein